MKELFKSLGQFREQVSSVKKDADNPFYKSKYADLNSILEVIKNPLLVSGLAISHNCKHTESGFIVVTTLAHIESGEHMESEFPVFGNKPQEIWSSMSYARRYNILALLDIPTEDDDGQKANEAPRTQKEVREKKWFNYKDLKQCISDWTDTEILLSNYIKDNWYTLSGDMKTCLRTYCDSGELIEPVRK